MPSVQRPADGIDDATEQLLTDGRIQDATGTFDAGSRLQVLALVKQNTTDFVPIQVEREPMLVAGETQQLVRLNMWQPDNVGDAAADFHNSACFAGADFRFLLGNRL
jgi:hypothetical protein